MAAVCSSLREQRSRDSLNRLRPSRCGFLVVLPSLPLPLCLQPADLRLVELLFHSLLQPLALFALSIVHRRNSDPRQLESEEVRCDVPRVDAGDNVLDERGQRVVVTEEEEQVQQRVDDRERERRKSKSCGEFSKGSQRRSVSASELWADRSFNAGGSEANVPRSSACRCSEYCRSLPATRAIRWRRSPSDTATEAEGAPSPPPPPLLDFCSSSCSRPSSLCHRTKRFSKRSVASAAVSAER